MAETAPASAETVPYSMRDLLLFFLPATAWLIRRFIDREATLLFCPPEDVEEVQRAQGATGFDAPGARYPHRDEQGRCSFEALVDEHCSGDPALRCRDDHETVERAGFLYDALYAALREKLGA